MHALVCPLCRIALPPTDPACPRDGHAGREVAWLSVPPALSHRFHALQPFAHGDSGSLYIADEPETGRRGLLKVLAPVAREQLAERQRLRRELVKQATLARTHLVVPLASGDAEGATWIFREWLEGVTLEVRLSRGPLQQVEALAIAAQVASALDELHRGGLLHRDVKPGHVFLQATSHGLPRVLLLDAGIVSPIALRSGTIYGTPGYVAPEQLLGNLVSFRSDLYSLGSVLYRMLTGRPAFDGDDDAQTLDAQRLGQLPPLPPTLPPGIGQLLSSLLAREPQERPFSAQKLRRTLEPFLPDDALIERSPTSSFELLPRERKPTALPSGTLRPPAPPAARGSLSGTMIGPGASSPLGAAPAARAEPPVEERTDSLELDQVEEELEARSHPPPAPGMRPPSDKTQPIRLDQILAVADGRRGTSRPPPALVEPPRDDATLVEPLRGIEPSAGDALAPARGDLRPHEEPRSSPIGASDFGPRDDGTPLPRADAGSARLSGASAHGTLRGPIAAPESVDNTIEVDALARALAPAEPDRPEPARAPIAGKQTLVGLGISPLASPEVAGPPPAVREPEPVARSAGPGEPAPRFVSPKATLPLGSALPSAASLQEAPPAATVQPGAAVPLEPRAPYVQPPARARSDRPPGAQRERDIPTEPIPVSSDDPSGALPAPWWMFGGDRRRAITYGSAALVGLAVLGVGVSALFSGEPERAPAEARAGQATPPPALPAVTSVAREDDPPAAAQPAAPAAEPSEAAPSRPVRERPAARAPEPTSPAKPSRAEARREARSSAPAKAPTGKPAGAKEAPASKPRVPDDATLFTEARDQAREAYNAKRYKDAAAAYERAIRYDPASAAAYAGLGGARLQAGDDKGAVQAYQRAVQLSPGTSGFHAALGRAYLTLGDPGRARSAYKQALALDPKNEAAKAALKGL